MQGAHPTSQDPPTMIARISADDTILYVNSALAAFVGMPKEELIGRDVAGLLDLLTGQLGDVFRRGSGAWSVNEVVSDAAGRVFEVSKSFDGAILDVILTEVTNVAQTVRTLSAGLSLPAERLTDEEMRSIWRPERRILTVFQARLCGLDEMAGSNPPLEVRLLLNLFLEETLEAIRSAGGTLGDASPASVQGIFGSPRYYRDHPLRALQGASDAVRRIGRLRGGLHRLGKEIPPISCGIASGEVLLAAISAGEIHRLSVSGSCVALASQLCRLARPGEILVSQFALSSILGSLPDGWKAVRAESEDSPNLAGVEWHGDEIQELPANLSRQVYLLGPGVDQDPDNTEFYFDYLYTVRAPGFETPVPVLRMVRPERAGVEIELSEDNVVTNTTVQVLGKYKLHKVVGQGGMGKVWRGEDRFGNLVAIKVLNSAETAGEETVKRFQREAEIMSRLPHRNICRIFEINVYEGIQFIAMEFVDGLTLADLLYEQMNADGTSRVPAEDLRSLIKDLRASRAKSVDAGYQPIAETTNRPKVNRILPIPQVLTLFGKICDGIQFAHEHGILHRDLKPGNVLIREDGEPLVVDFGLAKLDQEDVSLSISGHVVGTLENMAPEQAESSKDVDERADVYSLSTILYQMLTGRRHFHPSGNIVADAQTLKHFTPIRPRQWNPKIDPDLELVVLKGLRCNREERYRNVAALRADLDRFRRGEMISARPVSAMELTKKLLVRNRAMTAVVAVFLLLLAAMTFFSFRQINERRIIAENALRLAEEEAQRADNAIRDLEEQKLSAQLGLTNLQLAQAEGDTGSKTEAVPAETENVHREKELLAEKARKLQEELDALRKQTAARQPPPPVSEPTAPPAPGFVKEAAPPPSASVEEFGTREEPSLVVENEVMLYPLNLPEEETNKVVEMEIPVSEDAAEEEISAETSEQTSVEEPSSEQEGDFWTAEAGSPAFPDQELPDAVRVARESLMQDLSPYYLRSMGEMPEQINVRVRKGLHHASMAVLVDPENPLAQLLKSRFHLALHEIETAFRHLQKAETVLVAKGAKGPVAEQVSRLRGLVEKVRGKSPSPFDLENEIAIPLQENGTREDFITAALIQFPLDRNPEGERPPVLGEALMELKKQNPKASPDLLIEGELHWPVLHISNAKDLTNLSALKGIPIQELRLRDLSSLDWSVLNEMKLRRLYIEDSTVTTPAPEEVPGLAELEAAGFHNTPLESIAFLAQAEPLRILDLSGTGVTDLSPVIGKNIIDLNLDGIELPNILLLSKMTALESVVLDQSIAADPAKLHFLRFHRTLKSARTAEDPEGQPLQELLRKSAQGVYSTGG